MTMISYAQNREDILLARIFGERHDGFYIDVGANHPLCCSVTKHFYELGWHGINVEPNARFPLLAEDRPRDANLNVAIGDREGQEEFYEFPQAPALSTFVRLEAEEHRTRFGHEYVVRQAPVRTLAGVCREHDVEAIDFLSIDVEGYERQVLAGADWRRWRPRVVLVEATRPHQTIATHDAWEQLLLDADYQFTYFDGINRFYLRAEDRALARHFAVPPNVFDDYILYEHIEQIVAAREECQRRLDEQAAALQTQQEAIDRLTAECQRWRTLGPTALAFARQLRRFAADHPRLAAWVRRWRQRTGDATATEPTAGRKAA